MPEGVEEHFCLNISSTHADSKGKELMCWLEKCKSLFHWCVRSWTSLRQLLCHPSALLLDSRHFPLFFSVMRSSCQNETLNLCRDGLAWQCRHLNCCSELFACRWLSLLGLWGMLRCCPDACSLEPKPGVLTGAECSLPPSVAMQCLHLITLFILETGGICPILDQYVFVGFVDMAYFSLSTFWTWKVKSRMGIGEAMGL